MRRLITLGLMISLTSCQFHTSTRIADWGRVHKGIAIKADSLLQDDKRKLYARGRTGTYERRGNPLWAWAMTQPRQGELTQVEDVFKTSECQVSLNIWLQMATEANDNLEHKQPAGKLLGDWENDAVYLMGEEKTTAHAWWAYPLAGVCAIAIDVPLSLICTLPVAISLPFCELCISVRDGVCDVAAQVAPQQQEPVVVEGK